MKRVISKSDPAVSPIIGTVLLIAITVTLAASLYTLLGSYFDNLQTASPTVSLKAVNDTALSPAGVNGTYTLFITYVSNNISNDNVQVMVTMNNTDIYTFTLSTVEQSLNSTYVIFSGSSGNLTASYDGTAGYLTSSSSIRFNETNNLAFISRISLIDHNADSAMGSITIIS